MESAAFGLASLTDGPVVQVITRLGRSVPVIHAFAFRRDHPVPPDREDCLIASQACETAARAAAFFNPWGCPSRGGWRPALEISMNDFCNPLERQIATVAARPDLKFALGHVVVTAGVHALIQQGSLHPFLCLGRHAAGDWGDMTDHDKAVNERALQGGSRIFSTYEITPALTLYVITEWDRSVTTLLLPSEY
jgi:hypothetical protein